MTDPQPPVLTNLELEVMQVVWAAGPEPVTVRDVVEHLNRSRSKKLAYNTVQTMLVILRDKGVVEARKGPGRAHAWRPTVSRDTVSSSMVGDLVDRLFAGRVEPLLHHLVEREGLDRDELAELRRRIDKELEDDAEGAR